MFKELENEVKELNDKIKSLCMNNIELSNLYKGCQIYFSDIVINPTIMLIGFNPGAGYFHHNNKIIEEFEPDDKLDYLYEDYRLARQMKKLFSLMGKEELLENTFKTNIYFFATENINEFHGLLNCLSYELRNELINKSNCWIKEMVNFINPRNIICEGFSTFNILKQIFKDTIELIDENTHLKYARIGKINVFSVKRLRSNILKKDIAALFIKENIK